MEKTVHVSSKMPHAILKRTGKESNEYPMCSYSWGRYKAASVFIANSLIVSISKRGRWVPTNGL